MFTKKLTTISIATVAALGSFAVSLESASAGPGGGFRVHGGVGMTRTVGFRHPGYWGHRHRFGWGVYGAPLLVSTGAYALDCYYVRRRGALYKICE